MTRVKDFTSIYELLRPQAGHAKVLVHDTSSDLGDWLAGFLSESEHEECQQYHQSIDRKTIAAMRGLWKLGAGALSDIHPGQVEFERSMYGRPELAGKNQQLDLNVSRTGSWCGIVLSCAGACGIDIEMVDPDVITTQMMEMLGIAESNRAGFLKNPKTFFEHWTSIEACLKADGRGLNDGLGAVSYRPAHDGNRLEWSIDSKIWAICPIQAPEGVVVSCAFGDEGVTLIEIDACELCGMI